MVLTIFYWILLLVYLASCIGLIAVVLLQKGKGVGFAGAFGVGDGSNTLFGPRSAKSMPQKLTYLAAGLFMVLSLILSILSTKVGVGEAPELEELPAMSFESINTLMEGEGTTEAPAEDAAPDATPAQTPVPAEAAPAEAAPAEAAPAEEAAPEAQ